MIYYDKEYYDKEYDWLEIYLEIQAITIIDDITITSKYSSSHKHIQQFAYTGENTVFSESLCKELQNKNSTKM